MAVLVRYGAVSVLALAADVLIYTVLLMNAWPATASATVGYAIGIAIHYVFSRRRVFQSVAQGTAERREMLGFFLSGLLGLAITTGIVHVGAVVLGANPMIAKALAVIVSFILIYLVRRTVVFTQSAL